MILIVAVLQAKTMFSIPPVKLIITGTLPMDCIANKLIMLLTMLGNINPIFSPISVCSFIKSPLINDFKIMDR